MEKKVAQCEEKVEKTMSQLDRPLTDKCTRSARERAQEKDAGRETGVRQSLRP